MNINKNFGASGIVMEDVPFISHAHIFANKQRFFVRCENTTI